MTHRHRPRRPRRRRKQRKLVEMTWDPITRIVGSLGHLHQDRLRQPRGRRVPQHVVDLPRLQHLHEGQGPARRPLHHQPHLRHLRRQPRHLRHLRPEHGVRRPAAGASAEWIVNLGEAAEYMFDHNIFQDNLVGVDFCEQMVKETNPGVWAKAEKTDAPHADAARLPHDRRHHDGAQPVHRRVLPRGAADEPLYARDVLPDGRPARPSLDALSGRRRHRADGAALHRLPRPADEVRRVHEEGRAAARRPVRLLLRGAARLRGGRPAPRRCSAAGARSTTRTSATTPTRT